MGDHMRGFARHFASSHNGNMPRERKKRKSDFRDCSPISSPSRKAKKVTRESAPPERSSNNEVEDSLISGVLAGEAEALYVLCLRTTEHSIIVLNREATDFFMVDFNLRKKVLWESRYVSLQRKSCVFNFDADTDQNPVWVYSCSCDQHHAKMVATLSSCVNMKHEDWLQINPGCLHISVLKTVIENFDIMFSLTPAHDDHPSEGVDVEAADSGGDDDDDEHQTFLNVNAKIVCVRPPSSSWGILTGSAQGIRCITCGHSCGHVKFLLDSLESELCPDFIAEFVDRCQQAVSRHQQNEWKPKCLSYRELPFDQPGVLEGLFYRGNQSSVFSATGEVDKCPLCESSAIVSSRQGKEVSLLTQYQRATVLVFSASCSACLHHIPFDGSKNGILNMDKFLIGHDVLRDYLYNFLHGRMPLFTFYTCWKQRQVDSGHNEVGMLSYCHFRNAWYSFLSLIGGDLDATFKCPICRDSPSVVILDGTGLAFRRSYVPTNLLVQQDVNQTDQIRTGRFQERVMINNKKTRELLQSYCHSRMPAESLAVLLSSLATHSSPVKRVVEWCTSKYGEGNIPPKEVRSLLISLSKPSPVCALLPATEEARELLHQVINTDVKQQPHLLRLLQTLCPVLFNLVKALQWTGGSLPDAFSDLLKELWTKSIAAFPNTEPLTCSNASTLPSASASSSTVPTASASTSSSTITSASACASSSTITTASASARSSTITTASARSSTITTASARSSTITTASARSSTITTASASARSSTISTASASARSSTIPTASACASSSTIPTASASARSSTITTASACASSSTIPTASASARSSTITTASACASSSTITTSSACASSKTITTASTSASTSASSRTARYHLPLSLIVTSAATSASTVTAASTHPSSSASASSSTVTTTSTSTETSSTDREADSFLDSVVFWPHLPRVRERGTYPMDMKRDIHSCTKQGKGHKTLLPGTVTLHCQHGICYGFEVMLKMESPNTIFSILRTRFASAPDVVIYDFACGLHNYCLNRDPKFFQHTKFVIDRYHQPNHTGCSLGYKMSLYPQFKDLNSQIAEQKNSKLARIKSQLSYMNPSNFMRHATLFLWYNNKTRIASLTS